MTRIRNQAFLDAFGENLKKLRTAKKMSREAMAAEAGIEVMQIYRIENGKTNTTISTVLVLATALNVTPRRLMDFEY